MSDRYQLAPLLTHVALVTLLGSVGRKYSRIQNIATTLGAVVQLELAYSMVAFQDAVLWEKWEEDKVSPA